MADPGMSFRLAGIPEMIAVRAFDDRRTVYVVLPATLPRAEDDLWLAPMEAILTFDQGDAFLRPPTEPHPKTVAIFQNAHVEASSQLAAEHGIVLVFDPAGASSGGVGI
jgi:hypothetical protein